MQFVRQKLSLLFAIRLPPIRKPFGQKPLNSLMQFVGQKSQKFYNAVRKTKTFPSIRNPFASYSQTIKIGQKPLNSLMQFVGQKSQKFYDAVCKTKILEIL